MTTVRLQNVEKSYGETPVLHNINLIIPSGQFVTLLGPSGCGKTTTLRIVAGFIRPSSGYLFFEDREITALPPGKRNVSMVFQDYVLFPHLTVFENIAFGLRERRVPLPQIRQRVAELLDLVHLQDLAGRYPAQLSGGQKQRVGLARALAVEPQVLLMDEPLSALDLKMREAMQSEIRRIQKDLGITTVYVTHDQHEALTMSDIIVVMNKGRIHQVGTPQEIYQEPATPFVASFVGQMNFPPVQHVRAPSPMLKVPGAEPLFLPRAVGGDGTVRLGIRPEHLQLIRGESREAGLRLRGRVERVQYLGNLKTLLVRTAGNFQATVETAPHSQVDEGDEVMLLARAEHLLVWVDEERIADAFTPLALQQMQ